MLKFDAVLFDCDGVLVRFRERCNLGLMEGVKPIRNAIEAVAQVHKRYEGRIACASGADRFKVGLQLDKCGLMPCFKGCIFSCQEMPRSRSTPDVSYRLNPVIQLSGQPSSYRSSNTRCLSRLSIRRRLGAQLGVCDHSASPRSNFLDDEDSPTIPRQREKRPMLKHCQLVICVPFVPTVRPNMRQ